MNEQDITPAVAEPTDIVEKEVTTDRKLVLPPVVKPQEEAPVAKPTEPVHLGHPASHKAKLPLDSDLEAACRHAKSLNRSVVVIVKNPADVREVERLMEGCKRKSMVKVSPKQTQKVLVRTL